MQIKNMFKMMLKKEWSYDVSKIVTWSESSPLFTNY
jgi:hypothetical protein